MAWDNVPESANTSTFRTRARDKFKMIYSSFRATLRTCLTLLFWYTLSTSIILTSKWLFNSLFSFPLTVTTFSNTLTSVWAFLLSRRPAWKPQPLTRRRFREYVLPIGITTALEIGCSNIALKILTVSFGTILKGGSPIFTMIWGLLFGIERFSTNLCLSLVTIASGIALASVGEGHSFILHGFVLQLMATALGGLRWAMTHVLLRGKPACVLPFAIMLEGTSVFNRVQELETKEIWIILSTLTLIGSLVFILLISEYWLVNATSSLALSVAGVFKELLTIAGGVVFFKEIMTLLNMIGFFTCQVGILAYVYIRYDPSGGLSPHENISSTEIPLTMAEVSDDNEISQEV